MALTFGNTTAPNNITTYLDSVFALSIANYRKTLTDNIGASNSILYEILKSDAYEEADGGTYIGEPLMYALADADSYDGYDELSSMPTDGITQADFEWSMMASPIAYNMKEVFQNKNKIVDLVKSRIMQSEEGIKEGWARAFMWGNYTNGGVMTTPRISGVNGSKGVNPLPALVSYNTAPSVGTALTIGGLNENTNLWWRNRWATSAATTYSGFIYEMLNMYNTVTLGSGGNPTLILLDQTSYQLFCHAYFSVYKTPADNVAGTYPFEAKKFLNAKVVMDDKVPDIFSGSVGTSVAGVVDNSAMLFGSAYFINTKNFKVRYQPGRDWEMLEDENGKFFKKPINGDSRLGHVAWMGNTTINKRSKQGVLAKIPRTLT